MPATNKPRRSINLHVRITEEMYDGLLALSRGSAKGETVSDIAREGMQREIERRNRRKS